MTAYTDSIDAMYTAFRVAWIAGSAAIAGYIPDAVYDDQTKKNHASLDAIFVRLSIQNMDEGQIGMGYVTEQSTLYETVGILTIQLFVPKDDAAGVGTGRALATLIRDAFRSNIEGVNCINATIREQPPEVRWRQTNISVEYDFTEAT